MFSRSKNQGELSPEIQELSPRPPDSNKIESMLENYVVLTGKLKAEIAKLKEDLSHQKKLHGDIADSLDEFLTIQKASEIITQYLDYEKIAGEFLGLCHQVLDFDEGRVYICDQNSWRAADDSRRHAFDRVVQSMQEEGIIEWIWQQKHGIVIPVSELIISEQLENFHGNLVITPLIINDKGLGICLFHTHKEQANFSLRDLELLNLLTQQAAIAIQYTGLYKDLETTHLDLKNSQAQLMQAIKLATVGDLAGGIAHEINNPLQIILGKIQIARFSKNADDALQIVETQAMRIATIVRGLLSLARNRSTEAKEFIEINPLINSTLNLIRGQIEKRAIKIEMEMGEKIPIIVGNSSYLQQIILSFLLNAKKTMTSGGLLKIRTEYWNDKWIKIEFSDTGVALKDAEIEAALHPFAPGSPPSEASQNLGLVVSVEMIREIGGEVEIESGPESGNRIIIKIPKSTREEMVYEHPLKTPA